MSERDVSPIVKLLLEIGPLAVFFLSFQFGERLLAHEGFHGALSSITGDAALASESGPLFVATALFMLAIAISLTCSWVLQRTLPRMALVTGVVVVLFGGLTLWLRDGTFIKMKPTIVNGLFALILGVGLFRGRSYLKDLIGETMPLTTEGWMIFTRRWIGFFLLMALLNEVVWRTQTQAFWVSFKTFANPLIAVGFMLSQLQFLKRHSVEEPDRPG